MRLRHRRMHLLVWSLLALLLPMLLVAAFVSSRKPAEEAPRLVVAPVRPA